MVARPQRIRDVTPEGRRAELISLRRRNRLAREAFLRRLLFGRDPKVRGGAPLNSLQRGGTKSPETVHEEGLEPPHLAVPEPKSGASANSATRADEEREV